MGEETTTTTLSEVFASEYVAALMTDYIIGDGVEMARDERERVLAEIAEEEDMATDLNSIFSRNVSVSTDGARPFAYHLKVEEAPVRALRTVAADLRKKQLALEAARRAEDEARAKMRRMNAKQTQLLNEIQALEEELTRVARGVAKPGTRVKKVERKRGRK